MQSDPFYSNQSICHLFLVTNDYDEEALKKSVQKRRVSLTPQDIWECTMVSSLHTVCVLCYMSEIVKYVRESFVL